MGGQFHWTLAIFLASLDGFDQTYNPLLRWIPWLTFLVGTKEYSEFDRGIEMCVDCQLVGMHGIINTAETESSQFHFVVCVRKKQPIVSACRNKNFGIQSP